MLFQDLTPRAQTILRLVVDAYVQHGTAVGSQSLSGELARLLGRELSPATIRNTMAEMEEAGLLYAPHTSAGRLPTDAGLRLFVDHLLEVRSADAGLQVEMAQHLDIAHQSLPQVLEKASTALSSLSQCAGLVAAPKKDRPFRQVEFVSLSATQALVVWVAEDGSVENRLISVDPAIRQSDLQKAADYMNRHLYGRTLAEAREQIHRDIAGHRHALDSLTQNLVEQGLIMPDGQNGLVIVRGQAHLLNDIKEVAELERLRKLFETLEHHETLLNLVEETGRSDGVQIFIGAQNNLFNHSGCAMIVAPYKDSRHHVIGAIGVIGPARMNYGRIIPMVDFTAKLLSGALQ